MVNLLIRTGLGCRELPRLDLKSTGGVPRLHGRDAPRGPPYTDTTHDPVSRTDCLDSDGGRWSRGTPAVGRGEDTLLLE